MVEAASVEGVLLLTEPDQMTGGRFNVYVTNLETLSGELLLRTDYMCTVQNGVGENAKGGAFNCGRRYGRYFRVQCVETCSP